MPNGAICPGFLIAQRHPFDRAGRILDGVWCPLPKQHIRDSKGALFNPRITRMLKSDDTTKWETGYYLAVSSFSYEHNQRTHNWPSLKDDSWIQILFVLVAAFYGALHCIAWNSEVSNNVQKQLW